MMPSDEKPKLAYHFFREQLDGDNKFTKQDVMDATGWKLSSVDTYLGKQWSDFVERVPDSDTLRMKPTFYSITEQRFLGISTQKRQVFARYKRVRYSRLISWEFLLPLTRENELRRALDDLFYGDAIAARLAEVARNIGLETLGGWVDLDPDESGEEEIINAVTDLAGSTFFGYSISHVSGRFRVGDELRDRAGAARVLRRGGDYLVDETTAVVRFIAPIQLSKAEHDGWFTSGEVAPTEVQGDLQAEVARLQNLFFHLFVEAVVGTVQGEDEIWLLEDSPLGHQLYVWEKQ